MEQAMIRRFLILIGASAMLAALAVLVCQLVFPDVLPYAVDENAQQAWRRQLAFLVTTVAWLSAEVSVVGAVALAALLWRERRVSVRH